MCMCKEAVCFDIGFTFAKGTVRAWFAAMSGTCTQHVNILRCMDVSDSIVAIVGNGVSIRCKTRQHPYSVSDLGGEKCSFVERFWSCFSVIYVRGMRAHKTLKMKTRRSCIPWQCQKKEASCSNLT